MARVPIATAYDPALARPADIPRIVGDPTRLHQATGWEPLIPLEQSLRDILDDWRHRILL
jgi:GDP-4-dehydro-6-deoxy-D-mannose reductase